MLLSWGISFGNYLHAKEISGVLIEDTLKVVDSPFIVTAAISVPAGRTLTIEPGVVIKFNSGLSFTIDGTLEAVGTVTDSIQFTSNKTAPNSGDWAGIIFTSTGSGSIKYAVIEFAMEGVKTSNSSPTISKSDIRHNDNGIESSDSSSPLVESNSFHDNVNTAIRSFDSSPTISKNTFYNNTAIFSSVIFCQSSSPRISENLFRDNGNAAIDCMGGSNPTIWQNTIVENDFGVTISDSSSPSLKNNIIAYNTNIGIAINDVEASPEIQYNDFWANAGGNFFGTSPEIGDLTTTNSNGDSSDIFFNIIMNPQFVNSSSDDFQLLSSSPCIDAGDPANPAGILVLGAAPDMGVFEFEGTVPVELASFVFVNGVLKWTTVSETNNLGFEIQRSNSVDGKFIRVGFVAGAGTTVIPHRYEFRDTVTTGIYFYRLKQIDTDGTFEYSPIIKAVYSNPVEFSLAQNYPNPFNPATTITFEIPNSVETVDGERVTLSIYNARGQLVLTLLDEEKGPGIYKLRWHGVDKLGRPVSSGLYFYRLKSGNEILTRSMILTK
jgi:parallel beta-helix repeat protein